MKRLFIFFIIAGLGMAAFAQEVNNPSISEKPIPTLSLTRVVTNETTTTLYVKIVNSKQLPPFGIKTKDLYIRPVSDPNPLKLIKSDKAPFEPERHIFTSLNEVFEFSLTFPALPKGTKYFDLMDNLPKHEFFIQGIILDPKLNEILVRGFDLFSRGDGNGALNAFIEFANHDLYFEYGIAYFNIIYILSIGNRNDEAQQWYNKFKDRFFYDKKLLENEFSRLGIKQKLK